MQVSHCHFCAMLPHSMYVLQSYFPDHSAVSNIVVYFWYSSLDDSEPFTVNQEQLGQFRAYLVCTVTKKCVFQYAGRFLGVGLHQKRGLYQLVH